MNVFVNESKKIVVLALVALFLSSVIAPIVASDLSMADAEEDEVPQEYEDGFLFNGVYYEITNDEEDSLEVAVAKVTVNTKELVIETRLVIEEDESETVYSVTGILKGAFDREYTSLILPSTLVYIEDGAFTGFSGCDIYVLPEVTYEAPGVELREAEVAFEVVFNINIVDEKELKATNIGDFEDLPSQEIYSNINNELLADEYERMYFEFAGWSTEEGSDEVEFDDCQGVIADEIGESGKDMVFFAVWEEESFDQDKMWTIVFIIVVIAVIGFAKIGINLYRSH